MPSLSRLVRSVLLIALAAGDDLCSGLDSSACNDEAACEWWGNRWGCWPAKDDASACNGTSTTDEGWVEESLSYDGRERTYLVYVPSNGGQNGIMLFIHGAGQSAASLASGYQVAEQAETYGFIGVVPQGWMNEWNVDDPGGSNEVEFMHEVVHQVNADYAVPADAPIVALGFSNGAELAANLGCYDSRHIYVAHVGVNYRADSDFPSTCGSAAPGSKDGAQVDEPAPSSGCAEYLAVGENDWFIASIGTEGLLEQYTARRDELGCPEEGWNVTAFAGAGCGDRPHACYLYPSCFDLGQLCVYEDLGHDTVPSMASEAWTFLTGVGTCEGRPARPPAPPTPPPQPLSPERGFGVCS